ncbi:hypothetical protein BQ8482_20116 [Mesorhizobium delmotii]|uniref:Uncharacterized protein n=1 Tax=Mesorhizobium delmotii TaxID=1631247 RepID=A0A2P9AK27_9HYPH|nr:hypothetical protein BQ8482_20116 [Mesorhizobium delmotii]
MAVLGFGGRLREAGGLGEDMLTSGALRLSLPSSKATHWKDRRR